MKKIILLITFITVSLTASAQYYQLGYDSVRVKSKFKLGTVTTGASTDSVLTKKANGGVYKISQSVFATASSVSGKANIAGGNTFTSTNYFTDGIVSNSDIVLENPSTLANIRLLRTNATGNNYIKFQNKSYTLADSADVSALSNKVTLVLAQRAMSTSQTLSATTDYTALVGVPSSSDIIITLPNAPLGQIFVVKKYASLGGANVVVTVSGSIDNGGTTKTITVDYTGYVFQSAGSGQYYIIGTITP